MYKQRGHDLYQYKYPKLNFKTLESLRIIHIQQLPSLNESSTIMVVSHFLTATTSLQANITSHLIFASAF